MSSKDNLENLVRSGGLKVEPPLREECEGYVNVDEDEDEDEDEDLLGNLVAATEAPLAQVQEVMTDTE